MWAGLRGKKRCVVIAQGFYEWLVKDKNTKIAHYTKPKDGSLMVMAGFWDSVSYPGLDGSHETFTILTTESNKKLKCVVPMPTNDDALD